MERILKQHILNDLPSKIILLTGPRQCGKTTLSKQLNDSYDYFNYDSVEDRLALKEKSWDRKKKLIIFDELHKKRDWKQWLKGIYDTEGIPPEYLVTGSAMLDTYKRVGDSLAGRYFQYRLHPFDLKELAQVSKQHPNEAFDALWNCSGFPEPYLRNDKIFYNRWKRSHLDIILRQDLLELYSIRDIKSIETLVALLKKRIGSSVSYANLARDLECDATTIKRWLELLENLYVIYRVTPYSKNIVRSLLKEPKFYFYDWCQSDDEGSKLENFVASSLHKELNYIEDTLGIETSLHYLRTKDGKEIDFLIMQNGKPTHMLEVKTSNHKASISFQHFEKFIPQCQKIQLVLNLPREKTYSNQIEIRDLIKWLSSFTLCNNF